MNRAIFLDRDGTLNPDPGYISDPELFNLYPGTGEALSRLQQAGYLLILITNQSGIARGLLTHAQLAAIHHPDFPDADGVAACSCRKPEPGLILQAIEELQIDPEHSFMIGDKTSDVELGLNAGVTPVFIGAEPAPGFASVVNFATLSEVADWILAAEHEQR
jgi:HAD superfamily hydrolase (TIGR01662 family)